MALPALHVEFRMQLTRMYCYILDDERLSKVA
ncbi:hypothetical protein PM3016_7149 [Paenibacillus mucilaginosus 3016]|uniref:Uncharacterized protein n=2 Tax=Paenibacillus mucilaginosus TaxID=61624 RepID=H6NSH6_9BACL|nr:hypothetical protein PM3016_7149 [Paenibacillus mucilaginosus 3016]AFH66059.1 hypothetical protein B2K_36060 [Paenibacillus mucilaginosus K02]